MPAAYLPPESGDIFNVSGLPQPDLLGVWGSAPVDPELGLAFAVSEAPPALSVWRAALPADARLAGDYLTGAEQLVVAGHSHLEEAARRLDTILQAASAPAGQPETALMNDLRVLQSGQLVAFGVTESVASGWATVARQTEATVEQLQQAARSTGLVETELGGAVIGQTLLDWTGGERTVWWSGCAADQMALHRRTVTLAVASRIALLDTLAIVVRGAARAALLLSLPGGPLLALPTVMRFIEAALRPARRARGAGLD